MENYIKISTKKYLLDCVMSSEMLDLLYDYFKASSELEFENQIIDILLDSSKLYKLALDFGYDTRESFLCDFCKLDLDLMYKAKMQNTIKKIQFPEEYIKDLTEVKKKRKY